MTPPDPDRPDRLRTARTGYAPPGPATHRPVRVRTARSGTHRPVRVRKSTVVERLPGAGAWFRVVSAGVLVRVLPMGFRWRDAGGARRINVRF